MTNLHEASDISATLSETDLSIRRFRGASYEEALAQAESELGEHIRVIGADRIRRGGLGGFFATDLGVEVVVVPAASDTRSTVSPFDWGPDAEHHELDSHVGGHSALDQRGADPRDDLANRSVSDHDWNELMRRVEADEHHTDERRAGRPTRAHRDPAGDEGRVVRTTRAHRDPAGDERRVVRPARAHRDPASVGVDRLLDEAERSDRLLSSWAQEDDDVGDPTSRPSLPPRDAEHVEPATRQRRNIIDGGDGGARLLDDVLAVSATDTAVIIEAAPVLSAPEVEPSVTTMPDPLRRPTELATIAAGRLTMRLAKLPPFSGDLQAGTYRVQVAVTTPDGTRIEMSTQVDGSGD